MNPLLSSKTKLECSSETFTLGLVASGRMSRAVPSWDLSILKTHSVISHQASNLHGLSHHLHGQATYILGSKLHEHASRIPKCLKTFLRVFQEPPSPFFPSPPIKDIWEQEEHKKTAVEGTAAIHTVSGTIQPQHLLMLSNTELCM